MGAEVPHEWYYLHTSLIPRLLPIYLLHTVQKQGKSPDDFIMCVMMYYVWFYVWFR